MQVKLGENTAYISTPCELVAPYAGRGGGQPRPTQHACRILREFTSTSLVFTCAEAPVVRLKNHGPQLGWCS
eukprot:14597099-Alexandrium_andersonii.AAC.1